MMNRRKVILLLVCAVLAGWFCWLFWPVEPEMGPLRHDIEPLQKRLGAEMAIRGAEWRVRRLHAEDGFVPYQDNGLLLMGVLESEAAAALVEAASDKQAVQVSFEDTLVQEPAWESPELLKQLTAQLRQRTNKPMGSDCVQRFAWCPQKKQVYIELVLY